MSRSSTGSRPSEASARMFELLSGLVAAEEGTRGQLARGDARHGRAVALSMARMHLTVGDSDSLRQSAEHLTDAEEQVRAVMARTRPPALRDGDLASAMSRLKADLEQRYGLSVDISWPATAYPCRWPARSRSTGSSRRRCSTSSSTPTSSGRRPRSWWTRTRSSRPSATPDPASTPPWCGRTRAARRPRPAARAGAARRRRLGDLLDARGRHGVAAAAAPRAAASGPDREGRVRDLRVDLTVERRGSAGGAAPEGWGVDLTVERGRVAPVALPPRGWGRRSGPTPLAQHGTVEREPRDAGHRWRQAGHAAQDIAVGRQVIGDGGHGLGCPRAP